MPAAFFYSSTAGTYTLTGSITNSATSVTLSSTTGLPASTPFKVVIDPGQGTEEIVKVTGVAGTTLTVVRAWDGTSAAAHSAGATVRHMMTAEDLTLSRTHEAASTGVHGIAGALVGTTDAQSLTNKNLTGAGNTFPTSLVTLTGSQSLSSKTLNAPILTGAASAARLDITNNIDVSTIPLTVKGFASQTADILAVQDSAATNLLRVTPFDVKAGGANFLYPQVQALVGSLSRTVISADVPAVDVRGVLVRGIAAQTSNFFEARDWTGTVKWAVGPDGSITSPTTANSGVLTSGIVTAATGWSITSQKFHKVGSTCHLYVTASRTGAAIPAASDGDIGTNLVATLNSSANYPSVPTSGVSVSTGLWVSVFADEAGNISVRYRTPTFAISTGNPISFSLVWLAA